MPADAPPTFIAAAADDKVVPVENSVLMWQWPCAPGRSRSRCTLQEVGGHGFRAQGPRGQSSSVDDRPWTPSSSATASTRDRKGWSPTRSPPPSSTPMGAAAARSQLPAGRHLSFSIRLLSGVTLTLAEGCVLEAADPALHGGTYDPAEPNPHDLWQDFSATAIGMARPRSGPRTPQDVAILGPGRIDGAGLTLRGAGLTLEEAGGRISARHALGLGRGDGRAVAAGGSHGGPGQQGHRPEAREAGADRGPDHLPGRPFRGAGDGMRGSDPA
ncbi:hypothetical protein ACRAWD_19040 [Caulobacter segnis]